MMYESPVRCSGRAAAWSGIVIVRPLFIQKFSADVIHVGVKYDSIHSLVIVAVPASR